MLGCTQDGLASQLPFRVLCRVYGSFLAEGAEVFARYSKVGGLMDRWTDVKSHAYIRTYGKDATQWNHKVVGMDCIIIRWLLIVSCSGSASCSQSIVMCSASRHVAMMCFDMRHFVMRCSTIRRFAVSYFLCALLLFLCCVGNGAKGICWRCGNMTGSCFGCVSPLSKQRRPMTMTNTKAASAIGTTKTKVITAVTNARTRPMTMTMSK